MKYVFMLFIFLSLAVRSEDEIPAFFKCHHPKECTHLLFGKDKIWGGLQSNYKKAVALWKTRPAISFSLEGKQGEFKLERSGKILAPVIVLEPTDDPHEMIISLNHEILHYLNSFKNVQNLEVDKKINNCLSLYKLNLLKDEVYAFKEEIRFWEESPEWFQKHFDGKKIESGLLGQKISYKDYYPLLKEKIRADSSFIEKRYIDLGQYPPCAKEFFK